MQLTLDQLGLGLHLQNRKSQFFNYASIVGLRNQSLSARTLSNEAGFEFHYGNHIREGFLYRQEQQERVEGVWGSSVD
jgi:hypothetical protein